MKCLGLRVSVMVLVIGSLAAYGAPAPASPGRTNSPPASIAKIPVISNDFLLEKGFKMDLVATQPIMGVPIAMAFDENGRLFVLERDEKTDPAGAILGRLRVLEDNDGNGVFNSSAIYASDIPNPTALICYGGGVFVGAAGQILYLKDTAFNGSADLRREVFKSFGEATNGFGGQVIITGFAWGMDNRIHVTTAGQGGDVISSSSPGQSIVLRAGNFAFDPRSFLLTVESGSANAGMCFDNLGQRIVAERGRRLETIMYEARYAARNPYVQLPNPMRNLTDPNPNATRSQFSADSIAIYRGGIFPAEYSGDVFTTDDSRGIVHRSKLRKDGIELFAENPGVPGVEFLRSRDNFFEFTQVIEGPDGGLYVAGTRRGAPSTNAAKTNAAPSAAPPRSCIYRIVPVNFKPSKAPQLNHATSEQLVLLLRHSNGWLRDTAMRLLYERQDRTAAAPLIRLLYDTQSPFLARVLALHALDGSTMIVAGRETNALMEPHILKGLTDPAGDVRKEAVLLSEKFVSATGDVPDQLWGQLSSMAADGSADVRYQLAFTLGQIQHSGRGNTFAQILEMDPTNRWVQTAIASSLNTGAGEMLGFIIGNPQYRSRAGNTEFLRQLYGIVGARNQPAETTDAINGLLGIPEPALAFNFARALDNSLQRADSSLAAADSRNALQPLYNRAMNTALDANADENTRIQALRLLDGLPGVDPNMMIVFAQEWSAMDARLRQEAIITMMSQPNSTVAMLQGLSQGWLPPADLLSPQVRYFFTLRDPALLQLIVQAFGNSPDNRSRQPLVERYLPALQLTGRPDRGRNIFAARCATCHQLMSDGNVAGLTIFPRDNSWKERILTKIIDPNRPPLARNPAVFIQTRNGATFLGFVSSENGRSVTMCELNGAERVVGHANIQVMRTLAFSAMPEGLEAGMTQQDMADLLDYLCQGP